MSTDLDVANKALRHLGLSPVESLSANSSSMSRVLLDTLQSSLNTVLGSYDWSVNRHFDESVGTESTLVDYPEYRYLHDLTQVGTPPVNFDNIVSIKSPEGLYVTKYHRIGDSLYTAEKDILITYTETLDTVADMPEYLASLIAAHVAMEGCMALTGDGNKYYVMSKIYDRELRRARSQEFRMTPKGYTNRPDSASSFIQAHSGFSL